MFIISFSFANLNLIIFQSYLSISVHHVHESSTNKGIQRRSNHGLGYFQ